jgi:hypothetical protein
MPFEAIIMIRITPICDVRHQFEKRDFGLVSSFQKSIALKINGKGCKFTGWN